MQAIEFESVVQDQAIRLPTSSVLSAGQQVRVVVMFDLTSAEKEAQKAARQASDDLVSREPAHPVRLPKDRLATLEPHPDALDGALDDLVSSRWDEAAWRKKWARA